MLISSFTGSGIDDTWQDRQHCSEVFFLKDMEMVIKRLKELDGTAYRVFEQFPLQVMMKRHQIVPKMKEARQLGKRAYLAFNTLYIDGTPMSALEKAVVKYQLCRGT
ncbi:hypothetical protein DPMN_130666 [Dreissena polymorpha]|uniref:Uncharacterized protein n=1 Tax=Dreissena polymorpha TaxID=45954 RepID=A0A9D4H3A2_DREPO|nr:hypothetical protein DPMN_130666 [Dreissena polymorpha]